MQAAVILFSVLIIAYAQQPDNGGCCFYSGLNFQQGTLIACTNLTFRLEDFPNGKSLQIRSYYCTEFYSAAMWESAKAAEPMETISCGEVVNQTTSGIKAYNVTIGECEQVHCCLYTGKNKDGNEFCLFSDSAPGINEDLKQSQKDGNFAVAECTEDWRATLHHGGQKTEVDCGVTLDLPASQKFDKIVLTRCAPAQAIAEAVVDTMSEANSDLFDADLAVADYQEVGGEEVQMTETFADNQADQAFADFQVDQAVDEFQADQAFADFQADQAFADFQVEDEAMMNDFQADQAVADFQNDVVDEGLMTESFADNQADMAFADYEGEEELAFADSYENFDEQAFAIDAAAVDEFGNVFEADEYVDYATDMQGSSFSSSSALVGSLLAIVSVLALFL